MEPTWIGTFWAIEEVDPLNKLPHGEISGTLGSPSLSELRFASGKGFTPGEMFQLNILLVHRYGRADTNFYI